MTSTRLVLLPLSLALAAAAGCSSAGGIAQPDGGQDQKIDQQPQPDANHPDASTDATPLDSAASFIVSGKLTLTADNPTSFPNLPTTQNFTLRIDPVRGVITVGGGASAAQVGVKTSDRATFEATAAVPIPIDITSGCGAMSRYTRFSVTVTGQTLAGSADGTGEVIDGDVAYQYKAALTMTGRIDDAPPTLGDDRTSVDPLGGFFLNASEPLPTNAAASLVAGAETVPLVPFIPADGGGVVGGFDKGPAALRYATTYQVTATAGWTDLAGNLGAPLPKIVTAAAPPLAAEDGFESSATPIGGAVVVDATVLPPITGQHSVALVGQFNNLPALAGSRRLTVRLAVSTGDTKVRVSVRPFSQADNFASTYQASFRAAVPGGAIASAMLPQSETLDTKVTVGGATLSFGAARTIEIPLPAGASGEIVFDANTGSPSFGCGLPPPTVGYLIDDLRVE